MPDPGEIPGKGHNRPPELSRGEKLYQHLLALERLQEAKDDASGDYNERKTLAKEDGFDTNVLEALKKRRKNGRGQTIAFDEMLAEYETLIEQAEDHDEDRRDVSDIDEDELLDEARKLVIDNQKASTSWLQRQMRLGYNAASRLIEQLEADEIVSKPDHTGRRSVLVAADQPEAAGEESGVNEPAAPAPTEPPETGGDSGI